MSTKQGCFRAFVPLVVKTTDACGKGTFAGEPIKEGTRIARLSGERISYNECVSRIRQDGILPDDPLQIGPRSFLQLDEPSRFFNHCCEPNAGLFRTSDLKALRDIPAGEEIRYDYSETVPPSVPIAEWTMPCRCGAPTCRQLIGNVMTLPVERIAELLGVGQDYMQRELWRLGRSAKGGRVKPLAKPADYPPAIIAIRPSQIIPGQAGVFAVRSLPRDTIIAKTEDWDESIMISWNMFAKLDTLTQKRLRMLCWQSPEGVHAPSNINQLSIPWHINHSCEPNCYIDTAGNYRGLRKVKGGEELTIDIGTIMTDPGYKLKCRCGLPNCVGTIRSRHVPVSSSGGCHAS